MSAFIEPDQEILGHRNAILDGLTRPVGPGGLITTGDECRTYETMR